MLASWLVWNNFGRKSLNKLLCSVLNLFCDFSSKINVYRILFVFQDSLINAPALWWSSRSNENPNRIRSFILLLSPPLKVSLHSGSEMIVEQARQRGSGGWWLRVWDEQMQVGYTWRTDKQQCPTLHNRNYIQCPVIKPQWERIC